jgi:hypothetical protein
MKPLTIASLMLALTCSLPALADRIGNGGGGVYDEATGEYRTFHAAGFYVEPAFLSDSDLPELAQLRTLVRGLGLSPLHSAKLLQGLVPTHGRRFFKVASSKFSRKEYESIKDEYRRVFRDDRINIAIYAITDTETGSTYVLPEFSKLSARDKLQILFHEALWLMAPKASYKDIVRTDDYMARYLKSKSMDAKFQLIAALDQLTYASNSENSEFSEGNTNKELSLLGFAYVQDKKSGALKGILGANGAISLGNLIGKDAYECYWNHNDYSSDAMDSQTRACIPLMKSHLLEISDRFPNSLFMKALLGSSPRFSKFNSVGSGSLIRGLGISFNHPIILSEADLYKGMIMISTVVQTQKQECHNTLFGTKCDRVNSKARTTIPLISFTSRVYVKRLTPPYWSTIED